MEREVMPGDQETATEQSAPEMARGDMSRPLLSEIAPGKPPTLNTLLIERMERIENVLSGLGEDVHGYGQEAGASLAAVLAQKEDILFWLKVVMVALILLMLAFGIYDGLLIVLFVHLGL
jgi:hypothetical protein